MPELIATKGGADANSYATAEEANNFLDQIYGASDAWEGQVEEDKKRLLITASQQIDEMPVKYDPESDTQSLTFPVDTEGELDDPDDDGWDAVTEAVIWQALHLLETYDAIKEAENFAVSGVRSESAAGMSKTVTGLNPFKKWSPRALWLLSSYVDFRVKLRMYR